MLDRKALVQCLCKVHEFRERGKLYSVMEDDTPTILANTRTVGKHVCTWVHSSPDGYTTLTKLHNKIVSQFEAGEAQEKFGGKLCEYVDCPICKTFLHPDVQKQGCTRIEVSLYACRGSKLSGTTAQEVVAKALALVSPSDHPGLFVVQLSEQQWANLTSKLNRCLVLAIQPIGEIFVAWYVHTTTGRVTCICIAPTTTTVENDKVLEPAVQWAAADFGFLCCPIFLVDVLSRSR